MKQPKIDTDSCRGSALMMAVFVLALLASMALIVVLVSQNEVNMSKADGEMKRAFYLAESATEHGREQLRLALVAQTNGMLGPQLDAAAGTNDTIDFDPSTAQPQFSGGVLTGFAGVGDDVPVVAPTQLGDGWYAAFVTNDPADGEANLTDSNEFVMVTGLGVASDGSFEVAQSIVQPNTLFPALPAAITLLGPLPELKMGSGKGWEGSECPDPPVSKYWADGAEVKGSKLRRAFQGTDCAPYRELGPPITVGSKVYTSIVDAGGGGGIPGMFTPTIGVVDNAAETEVEDEMGGSKIYYLSDVSIRTAVIDPVVPAGNYQQEDTIANLNDATEPTVIGSGLGTLHSNWQDCAKVKDIVETLRLKADTVCTGNSCPLPATTPSTVTFIDGSFRVPCDAHGYGLLLVTGKLDVPASASWNGIILVIGEGEFYRVKKEGFGNISGATLVADIAGPDSIYGNADDCTGGTGGFDSVYFEEQKKKAWGTTLYCSDDIAAADPGFREPMRIISFRQD